MHPKKACLTKKGWTWRSPHSKWAGLLLTELVPYTGTCHALLLHAVALLPTPLHYE